MQLNQFKGVVQKTSLLKRLLYVASILGLVVTLGLVAYMLCQKINYQTTITAANDTITALKDSIEVQSTATNDTCVRGAGFNYIVRKGDSFWLISKRMYGTGIYAAKIANDNKMDINDSIHVGDILIIKN
jgi:nucleoid-associated protein YgaU